MQGQRSSVSTLPENLSFEHGSTSSQAGIDSHVPWNNMQTSSEARLQEYRTPSSENDTQYSNHIGQSEWSLGETSSGAARSQRGHSERKREHRWSIHSQAALEWEECQLESSNILSFDDIDVNRQGDQTSTRPDSISQDLNMCSEFRVQEDDECQVIEHPNRHIPVGPSNEKMPSIGTSSDSLGMSSLDGRRLSCKRKALEIQDGQSSGEGSSNYSEHGESQWHGVTSATAQISATNVSMSTPASSNLIFSNGSEQPNSRIRPGVGEAVSSPLSTNSRRTGESSRRNFCLRFSSSHQQEHVPRIPVPREANAGISDVSSSRHSSRLVLRNRLFDLNPTPHVENGSHPSQSILQHLHSLRRNPHSRWSGASSSRASNPSSTAVHHERERDPMLCEESTTGNIPRSISEHPMFIPAGEMLGSSQQPPNWNLASGSNSIAGNAVSAPCVGSTSGVNSSSPSPSWSPRGHPHHPRRLSEIARRSLLSASGGQSSSAASHSSSRETAIPSGSQNNGPHIQNMSSALLERHMDSAFGIPHSLRSLGAAGEGRNTVMSEVHLCVMLLSFQFYDGKYEKLGSSPHVPMKIFMLLSLQYT